MFLKEKRSQCVCFSVFAFCPEALHIVKTFWQLPHISVFVGETFIIYHVETETENLKKLIDHSFEHTINNNEYTYMSYCYINTYNIYIVFFGKKVITYINNILIIVYLYISNLSSKYELIWYYEIVNLTDIWNIPLK